MVVPVQGIHGRNAAPVEVSSIHEVNVLPSVAIEIRDTHSRAKFLSINGDSVIAFEMSEADARDGRDICELNCLCILCNQFRKEEEAAESAYLDDHSKKEYGRARTSLVISTRMLQHVAGFVGFPVAAFYM
jgi:hypothetical protein